MFSTVNAASCQMFYKLHFIIVFLTFSTRIFSNCCFDNDCFTMFSTRTRPQFCTHFTGRSAIYLLAMSASIFSKKEFTANMRSLINRYNYIMYIIIFNLLLLLWFTYLISHYTLHMIKSTNHYHRYHLIH